MRLSLYSKGWALVKEFEIESPYVPRIGEIIEAPQELIDSLDGMSYLLVHQVRYFIDNNSLYPIVACQAASSSEAEATFAENRYQMLDHGGWIPSNRA